MKKDSAAVLLVVAADHLIPDTEEFTAACRAALAAAMAGSIVSSTSALFVTTRSAEKPSHRQPSC